MILAVDYYGSTGHLGALRAGDDGAIADGGAGHLRAIETREFERAIAAR
jgi:hypothetical protein